MEGIVSALASEYGYRFVTTGGNCTGYEQDLESDKSILITIAEDALAPINPNDLCVAYLYDDELGDYEPISQPLEFCKLLVLLKRHGPRSEALRRAQHAVAMLALISTSPSP